MPSQSSRRRRLYTGSWWGDWCGLGGSSTELIELADQSLVPSQLTLRRNVGMFGGLLSRLGDCFGGCLQRCLCRRACTDFERGA